MKEIRNFATIVPYLNTTYNIYFIKIKKDINQISLLIQKLH